MLLPIAIALLSIWGIALLFSVTLGGFIYVLPVAAAPMLVARAMQGPPETETAYGKWKRRHHEQQRR